MASTGVAALKGLPSILRFFTEEESVIPAIAKALPRARFASEPGIVFNSFRAAESAAGSAAAARSAGLARLAASGTVEIDTISAVAAQAGAQERVAAPGLATVMADTAVNSELATQIANAQQEILNALYPLYRTYMATRYAGEAIETLTAFRAGLVNKLRDDHFVDLLLSAWVQLENPQPLASHNSHDATSCTVNDVIRQIHDAEQSRPGTSSMANVAAVADESFSDAASAYLNGSPTALQAFISRMSANRASTATFVKKVREDLDEVQQAVGDISSDARDALNATSDVLTAVQQQLRLGELIDAEAARSVEELQRDNQAEISIAEVAGRLSIFSAEVERLLGRELTQQESSYLMKEVMSANKQALEEASQAMTNPQLDASATPLPMLDLQEASAAGVGGELERVRAPVSITPIADLLERGFAPASVLATETETEQAEGTKNEMDARLSSARDVKYRYIHAFEAAHGSRPMLKMSGLADIPPESADIFRGRFLDTLALWAVRHEVVIPDTTENLPLRITHSDLRRKLYVSLLGGGPFSATFHDKMRRVLDVYRSPGGIDFELFLRQTGKTGLYYLLFATDQDSADYEVYLQTKRQISLAAIESFRAMTALVFNTFAAFQRIRLNPQDVDELLEGNKSAEILTPATLLRYTVGNVAFGNNIVGLFDGNYVQSFASRLSASPLFKLFRRSEDMAVFLVAQLVTSARNHDMLLLASPSSYADPRSYIEPFVVSVSGIDPADQQAVALQSEQLLRRNLPLQVGHAVYNYAKDAFGRLAKFAADRIGAAAGKTANFFIEAVAAVRDKFMALARSVSAMVVQKTRQLWQFLKSRYDDLRTQIVATLQSKLKALSAALRRLGVPQKVVDAIENGANWIGNQTERALIIGAVSFALGGLLSFIPLAGPILFDILTPFQVFTRFGIDPFGILLNAAVGTVNYMLLQSAYADYNQRVRAGENKFKAFLKSAGLMSAKVLFFRGVLQALGAIGGAPGSALGTLLGAAKLVAVAGQWTWNTVKNILNGITAALGIVFAVVGGVIGAVGTVVVTIVSVFTHLYNAAVYGNVPFSSDPLDPGADLSGQFAGFFDENPPSERFLGCPFLERCQELLVDDPVIRNKAFAELEEGETKEDRALKVVETMRRIVAFQVMDEFLETRTHYASGVTGSYRETFENNEHRWKGYYLLLRDITRRQYGPIWIFFSCLGLGSDAVRRAADIASSVIPGDPSYSDSSDPRFILKAMLPETRQGHLAKEISVSLASSVISNGVNTIDIRIDPLQTPYKPIDGPVLADDDWSDSRLAMGITGPEMKLLAMLMLQVPYGILIDRRDGFYNYPTQIVRSLVLSE